MAVSGVRARNFIQPNPGGASAIFQRQRGMVAAAPLASPEVQGDPNEKESRMGKASGRDYAKFLGKNEGVIKGAVNTLKDLLVGTFIAAKSLGATLKAVVKQIKGMSGGGGGRGLFGTLGMIGLVGALIAGVAAIFGPQIQKAFEWLKGGADGIFQDLKTRLGDVDKKIEGFYNKIRGYLNDKIIPAIGLINTIVGSLKNLADKVYHLPASVQAGPFTVPLPFMDKIKGWGKTAYGHLNRFGKIDVPDPLPPYRDTVDANGMPVKGMFGADGINFLAQYNDVGAFGGAMMTGAGNLAMGGIENTTGFIGDIINNIIAALGLTGQANSMGNSLGMGNLFGESRELGSGPGIPSLIQQNQQNQQSGTGQKPNYGQGRVPTAVAGDKEFQQGVTDLAKKYNLNEEDLYGVMSFESAGSFDPAKKNMQGSGATGLIQFMPSTARGLGTSTNQLAGMSRTQQLKYVDKYFANKGIEGGNLDDLYMSILFPVAVGKPDNFVLFGKGAMSGYQGVAYDQNAGLDTNGDGSVTKKEAAASVRKHKAQMKFSAPAVQPAPNQNQSNVPSKPNKQQVSFLNNIGFTGGNQVAAAPRRPQPITTGNGSGTEGPDYNFFPPGSPDQFDIFGSQLGVA